MAGGARDDAALPGNRGQRSEMRVEMDSNKGNLNACIRQTGNSHDYRRRG
jgi:hypothetical protein